MHIVPFYIGFFNKHFSKTESYYPIYVFACSKLIFRKKHKI